MKNHNTPTLLTPQQIEAVSGGHGGNTFMTILGLPHVFMGLKEFVNYTVDLYYNGPEEDDHFTRFFLGQKVGPQKAD